MPLPQKLSIKEASDGITEGRHDNIVRVSKAKKISPNQSPFNRISPRSTQPGYQQMNRGQMMVMMN